MFRVLYYLHQLERRLWLRPALFSLIALLTPFAALAVQDHIPFEITLKLGDEAVEDILDILASSLLVVTTFSLGTMVAAYAAATQTVTPRATRLLLADTNSQNALATFIGVFMYALVSIIGLKTEFYTSQGRVILFGVTLLMVLLMVITLIRWVDYLARFGRVGDTTDRVENAVADAIATWRERPALGGEPREPDTPPPSGHEAVDSYDIGYVATIDMQALCDVASKTGTRIHVDVLPGAFVRARNPIAHVDKALSDDDREKVRRAFVVARMRSYEQDPRFGLAVLAEIASRALSPALNDAGTAIEVIGRGVRVLADFSPRTAGTDAEPDPVYRNVSVPSLALADLFDDLFNPIARDGSGVFEVQVRLQKAFAALAEIDPGLFGTEARHHAQRALGRAEQGLALEEDREVIRDLAGKLKPVRRRSGARKPAKATSL